MNNNIYYTAFTKEPIELVHNQKISQGLNKAKGVI